MKKIKKGFLCLMVVFALFMPMVFAGCMNNQSLITVSSSSINDGLVYGSGIYTNGEEVIIYAEAKENHKFSRWSDGNTKNPRIITVNGEKQYNAIFVDYKTDYTLTLTSTSSNLGSVYGSGEYAANETVLIYAEPKEGYVFSGWSDGNTDNPRLITVTEDIALQASFEEKTAYALIESARVKLASNYGGWDGDISCSEFNLSTNINDGFGATFGYSGHDYIMREERDTVNFYTLSVGRNGFYVSNNVNSIKNRHEIGVDVKTAFSANITLNIGGVAQEKVDLTLYSESIIFDKSGKLTIYFDYPDYGKIEVTLIYSIVY